MKSILFTFGIASMLFFGNHVNAQDQIIQASELPAMASKFLKSNFGKETIAKVEKDVKDMDYEVYFNNGVKVEFDKEGNWKEIDGNNVMAIPTEFIDKNILKYVSANYPNTNIVKIEKNRTNQEVELSNGVELKFDSNGKFIRMD